MKKILKRMLITTSSLVLAMAMSIPSSAAYVWHSDSNTVRYHEEIPEIKLKKIYTRTDFTRTVFEEWINSAAVNWRTGSLNAIPNIYNNGAGDDGDISFIGGSPQKLYNEYGIDFLDKEGKVVNGKTVTESTKVGTITVGGVEKDVKKIKKVTIYIMNKLSAGTYVDKDSNSVAYVSRTIDGHKNTVTHELGHALGYAGHALNDEDLMASGTRNDEEMEITERDRIQIRQILNTYAEDTVANSISEPISFSDWRNKEIEKENSIRFIQNTTCYVDNIIIGTPIRVTQGSLDTLSESDEECEYLLTEYTFKVSNYIFGDVGESLITVRSQVGNIFEIGKEYTFSSRHIDNTLFDVYTVNSSEWVLDNSDLSETEIKSLTNNISSAVTPCSISQSNEVVECLEPTNSSVEHNVDVAFVATITSAEEDVVNNIYDIKVADVNFLKGNVDESILNEGIRIKGNISVGEKYLMMFTQDEDGFIMMAAREDSIIDVTSDKYNDYIVAFECNG